MNYYKKLQNHYEKRLSEHGPNILGMDWPNDPDLQSRFKVLSNIVKDETSCSLLDLGCGVGLLIDYLNKNNMMGKIKYSGADISPKMIDQAKKIHPNYEFETRDILLKPYKHNQFDYVIMNGVLTEKLDLSQKQMVQFTEQLIEKVFQCASKGIAFNVMSSHLDWKREDLFHYPIDQLVSFLVEKCSRHIIVNMGYGLYEYTTFVFKKPQV